MKKIIFALLLSYLTSLHAQTTTIQIKALKEPSAAVIDGKNYFVYELLVTNHNSHDIQILDLKADGKSLGSLTLTGNDLLSRMRLLETVNFETIYDWFNPGPSPIPPPAGHIPMGRSALIFLQFVADKATTIPSSIEHLITTSFLDNSIPQSWNYSVQLSHPESLVLASPFSKGTWFPFNAPSDLSRHRRSVIRLYDDFYIAQRFAVDWMLIGENGFLLKPGTSSKENLSYVSYGIEILAVADAVVEAITDDIPENIPDSGTRAVTINLETITGNSLILNLGQNRYALYAHLQPGSLTVKTGDQVKKGQVIGRLGNSGNSTAPHLHFHVCDGPSALKCQGIPYVFESFKHQLVNIEGDNMQNLKFIGNGPIETVLDELTWNDRLIKF